MSQTMNDPAFHFPEIVGCGIRTGRAEGIHGHAQLPIPANKCRCEGIVERLESLRNHYRDLHRLMEVKAVGEAIKVVKKAMV